MNRKILKFINLANGQPYAGPIAQEKRVHQWLLASGFRPEQILYQPGGKCKPPDFIVKIGKRELEIECKTSIKKGIPMFNDTIPDENTLFIFSSKRYNDTTVFYGGDVVDNKTRNKMNECKDECIRICDIYAKRCKSLKSNTFGFIPGYRNRIQMRGAAAKINLFHSNNRNRLVQLAKNRNK